MERTENKEIRFNGFEEVEEMIEKQKLNLVVYQDNVYDLTSFKLEHPGGEEILEDYTGYDIEESFTSKQIHQHSSYAHQQLKQYKIGRIYYQPEENDFNQETNQQVNENIEQELQVENEQIPMIKKNVLDYQTFKIYLNIPLSSQVYQISASEYQTILENPCKEENIRYAFTGNEVSDKIFGNRWNFLKYQLLILVLLSIIYGQKSYSYAQAALYFVFGGIFWTFSDYLIQRFLVNSFRKQFQFGGYRFVHFIFFGRHLMFPSKATCTGYSPIFIGILFVIKYSLLNLLGMNSGLIRILILGCIVILIIQEYLHFKYHTSRFDQNFLSIRQNLHIAHHYQEYDKNFGILTEIWDQLFRTQIKY